jgi:hypothetical protein
MNSERIVAIVRQYAGPVSQCCMTGETTGNLCELHAALAEYDNERAIGFASVPTGKTYRFSTFQEMVDVVPGDRIRVCMEEFGAVLGAAKSYAIMVAKTAEYFAKQDGKELTKQELKLKIPFEWVDDGKGQTSCDLGELGSFDLKLSSNITKWLRMAQNGSKNSF